MFIIVIYYKVYKLVFQSILEIRPNVKDFIYLFIIECNSDDNLI